jgi:hypothetical protein
VRLTELPFSTSPGLPPGGAAPMNLITCRSSMTSQVTVPFCAIVTAPGANVRSGVEIVAADGADGVGGAAGGAGTGGVGLAGGVGVGVPAGGVPVPGGTGAEGGAAPPPPHP